MSVARSGYTLTNEYDAKVIIPHLNGVASSSVFEVVSSGSVAVAFGQIVVSTVTTYKAWKSTNGISWSEITSAPNTAIYAADYGAGIFVAAGAAGVIYTSPGTDGSTWTARTKAGTNTSDFNVCKYVNNTFFLKQSGTSSQYSSDGITWSAISGSSFNNASTIPWINSKMQNITVQSGALIFWTGTTVSTSKNIIALAPSSALPPTNWNNNVYAGTEIVTQAQEDPGDGLGAVFKIGTSAGANNFARFAPETPLGGNWTTTSLGSGFGSNSRIMQLPVGPATSNNGGPVPYHSGDTQAFYLKYTDGTYTLLHPASANYQNSNSQYGIGYWTWNESTVDPFQASILTENRGKFLPLFSDTSWATNYAMAKRVYTIGDKIFVWYGFPRSAGDSNNVNTNTVISLSRAIRPLRTTVQMR